MSVLHNSAYPGLHLESIAEVEDTDEYRTRMKTSIEEINKICKTLEGSCSFETVGEYFCLYINMIETARKLKAKGYPNLFAVEVGSYCGVGSAIMGAACAKVGWKLLCFDTFATRINNTTLMEGWDKTEELLMFSQWMETVRKLDLYGKNIIPIIGDSRITLDVLPRDSVAFSWIDGDHTLEFAWSDIGKVSDATISGGIMCVHDIDIPDVVEAINGQLGQSCEWKLISRSEPVTLQHPKGPNGKFYSPGWEIWRRD